MKWSRANDEEAQSMIELAVLMGFLLLVFLGTVDVSRFMYYDNAIRNAARVGAETAMEHCTSRNNCDVSTTPITPDVVLQSAACESYPYIKLTYVEKTSACNTSPCPASSYTGCCSQDLCISYPKRSGTPASQDPVYVDVGYNFQLVTPFIEKFFQTTGLFQPQSCFSATPNAGNFEAIHTLCARAIGRVD